MKKWPSLLPGQLRSAKIIVSYRHKKNSDNFNSFWIHDRCDVSAMLYQLSYETTVKSRSILLLGSWVTIKGVGEWKINVYNYLKCGFIYGMKKWSSHLDYLSNYFS